MRNRCRYCETPYEKPRTDCKNCGAPYPDEGYVVEQVRVQKDELYYGPYNVGGTTYRAQGIPIASFSTSTAIAWSPAEGVNT